MFVGVLSYLREPDSRSDMSLALMEGVDKYLAKRKTNRIKMKRVPTSEYPEGICSGSEPFISVALTTRLIGSQNIHAFERLMKSHRRWRWRDVKVKKREGSVGGSSVIKDDRKGPWMCRLPYLLHRFPRSVKHEHCRCLRENTW